MLCLRPSFLLSLDPARAFPVLMPIVAVSAPERLAAIADLPFMAFFAVLARPHLDPIEMAVPDLDQDLSLAV